LEILLGVIGALITVGALYYYAFSLEFFGAFAVHLPGLLGAIGLFSGLASETMYLGEDWYSAPEPGFKAWWYVSCLLTIFIWMITGPRAIWNSIRDHGQGGASSEFDGTRALVSTENLVAGKEISRITELESRWTLDPQELGKGNFKAVYRAHRQFGPDESNLQTAAIAKLRVARPSAYEINRFRQEQVILSTLDHANCIRLIDWPRSKLNEYWFATEYVGPHNLRDLWASTRSSKPIGQKQALIYTRQILAGLAHVHRKNIVHADLKLENLLITRDAESVRIADFGLAFFLDRPETFTFGGTLGYLAPEVIQGHEDYEQNNIPMSPPGQAADVYSIGLAILELVSSRFAWEGLTEKTTTWAIRNTGPRWTPSRKQ